MQWVVLGSSQSTRPKKFIEQRRISYLKWFTQSRKRKVLLGLYWAAQKNKAWILLFKNHQDETSSKRWRKQMWSYHTSVIRITCYWPIVTAGARSIACTKIVRADTIVDHVQWGLCLVIGKDLAAQLRMLYWWGSVRRSKDLDQWRPSSSIIETVWLVNCLHLCLKDTLHLKWFVRTDQAVRTTIGTWEVHSRKSARGVQNVKIMTGINL